MKVNDLTSLINQAISIIRAIVGICLVLLIAGSVARAMRFGIPMLPSLGATELAYLAGAYWAIGSPKI